MDFSKVTSLQIPEGNVTKIEDKEGKILWTSAKVTILDTWIDCFKK